MNFKSILKPDASVMAALATAGSVYAVYAALVGPLSQAQATEANHPALESSRKKAGYISFIMVGGLFLITRDGNVGSIGFGSIVAMEMAYRHGIMTNPATNKLQMPQDADYAEAGATVTSIDPNGVAA